MAAARRSKPPRPTSSHPAAWALLAVSSEQQAETLVHQRRWAEETAASQGWRLTRVVEGVGTGKAGPRRIVRDLLSDLGATEIEARPRWLLMIRADRLGRGSIIDSQIALRDLRELGVSVWTRDQGEVKIDTTMAQLISAATLAVAAHENDVRSDKMKQVRRRKREAGEAMGTIPYGLRRVNGRYVKDPERAPIVREVFKMRLQGSGYNAIGRRLIAIAPPQVYKNGSSRKVPWTPTRISDLLSNKAYIGPIIDEATFNQARRVAALLTNRRVGEQRKYPWPLAGSVRCSCGRILIGIACGNEPWRYRYYGCKARWEHEGKFRLIRAEVLEEQFAELLTRLRASPKLVERHLWKATTPVGPRVLERSIRDLKHKLSDVARRRDVAWELHAAGRVRAEDVQERLDALAAERDEIDERIAAAQVELAAAKAAAIRRGDVDALLKRAAQIFRKAKVKEQNQIARSLSLELGGICAEASGHLSVC